MKQHSKRYKEAVKNIDKTKKYSFQEAFSMLKETPRVKFDETIEMSFNLNIDPKRSDQLVRGTVALPHGTGKKIKIAVFCKGEQEKDAREAGADFIGAEDLIEKVSKGFLDFDRAIATPDMMKELSRLGKLLGPRGLMPSPKTGTVTTNIAQAVKEVKAGRVEFKSDKQAGIHVGIGKLSFSLEQLCDNANTLLEMVRQAKPTSVKGEFIKSIVISTTMGPGVKIKV